MKLVLVSQAPTPYLTPILNELARLVDLHVVFMSGRRSAKSMDSWATFRDPWGTTPRFRYSFFPSVAVTIPRADFHVQLSAGVSTRLLRLKPDLVLVHGWGPLMVEPIAWRVLSRHRAVMWTESTSFSGLFRGRVSNALRRALLNRVDAIVSNGTLATELVETLGVDSRKIITGCLPAPTLTEEPQLPGSGSAKDPRILFVGRLVPRKRLADLLRAFASLASRFPSATLTVVGDGPLRTSLEDMARDLGLPVSWRGRLEGAQLRDVYASHDLLVVPSEREVWGLVVNEALAAGIYVIASNQVGGARDLLGGGSGVAYPVGDLDALAASMENAMRSADLSSAGRAARRSAVASVTPQAFAEAMSEAAKLAMTHGSGRRRR